MKLCAVVCFVIVLSCVGESDSFKILKKLKDLLHPTEPSATSTIPTIPEYENRPGDGDIDWDQENSQSNHKSSTSQTWGDQGGGSTDSKTGYDSVKTRPYPGGLVTTETNNYNSYGTDQGNDPSYSSNIAGSSTTTDMYDQSNNQENFPGQSSFSGGDGRISSTTARNNYYDSQNSLDQNGPYNKNSQTTTDMYDQSNNQENFPGQSSFSGGDVRVSSTTPRNNYYDSQNPLGQNGLYNQNSQTTTDMYDQSNNQENFPGQSSFSGVNGRVSSTTPRNNYYDSQNQLGEDGIYSQNSQTTTDTNVNNEKENLPSVGGVSITDILSATPVNIDISWGSSDGQSSTDSSLNPSNTNYDDQSSVFSDANNSQTTTSRSTYSSSVSSPSNNQDSSYNQFSSNTPTTLTYDNSQLNNVDQRPPSGSSTGYGSSLQNGDQQKQTYIPKRNHTKHRDGGGAIIFPDDPSLNPTPETERIYGAGDPHFKYLKLHSSTRAPVGVGDGKAIIDGAPRICGPGQALDTRKNVCRKLARK